MKNPIDVNRIYRERAARGATPLGLVVILYEAAIDDMQKASLAMSGNDVPMCTSALRHALLVLQQLQGTLDFELGKEAAKQLDRFYNMIRGKLLEAQIQQSRELLQQQMKFMSEVRDCWVQAEKNQPVPLPPAAPVPDPATLISEDGGFKAEWTA